MANSTGIAVGCAVGIPCFVALLAAAYFLVKTRKRFAREDLEYQKNADIDNMNQDLSYQNLDQLRMSVPTTPRIGYHSESSDDGKGASEKSGEEQPGSPQQEGKKERFVPAYRKKMKSSMTNLSNSRSSSYTNLQGVQQSPQVLGSNSSINSSNTNTTNLTDHFYNNVPVIDNERGAESLQNSSDLARTLQQPTPSFTKKPNNRSSSGPFSSEEYDLKNNYNPEVENEIQEEDQYENEFTNYSENKRAFIEGLRPKRDQ